MRLRPRAVTLLAALLAGGLTDLIVLVPSLQFAYRSVPLHAMLETAATVIALLTTFLLWGRLRERKRLEDLLLFVALGVFSVSNLFFATFPAAFGTRPNAFSTWTTVAASALGGVLLALAALVPTKRLRHVERGAAVGSLAGALTLFLLAAAVWQSLDWLPAGIDPGVAPDKAHLSIVGNGVIVAAQALIALLFALSAVGFTRRAETDQDELLLWLGAGSAVAAVSRINYFMFPSLYSAWVYTGDAFRLVWLILLFVGAVREIQIYQRAYAESRVAEERRRIARDVHDGLAQELAFIANATRGLMSDTAALATLQQIASAAQRGLDESRRAIATLAHQNDDPFEVALIQTVEEVAQRLGTRVEIAAEDIGEVPVDEQEQLLRIVREAVANAGRHANADVVRVTCTNGGPLRLRIEDDGAGFDPEAVDASGFGLIVMRERAAAIGAQLEITSVEGRGTSVEVRV
jgi:signal transduction histidine kinase